jgi:dipeptidyl aminopeptidase/acylaminoacyl peptidase
MNRSMTTWRRARKGDDPFFIAGASAVAPAAKSKRHQSLRINSCDSRELQRSASLYKFPMAIILMVSMATTALESPAMAGDSTQCMSKVEESVKSICSICSAKNPSFSPNGKELAFITNLNGMDQVWIVPIEGGYPRLVTTCNNAVQDVAWSPLDTNTLAIGCGQGTIEAQIYSVHPDGTALKMLSPGGKTRCDHPVWTADSKKIMVSSNARGKGIMEAALIDPASGKFEWLLPGTRSARLLDVSADGKYGLNAYFTSFNDADLTLFDTATKKETALLAGHPPAEIYATFGPDKRTIYLITRAFGERRVLARIKLGPDGTPGQPEIIASKPDADLAYLYPYTCLLNPSGDRALLKWAFESGAQTLDLIELPSGKLQDVLKLPAGTKSASSDGRFSPDGRKLALTLFNEVHSSDIWLLDLDTKNFRQLTFSPHPGVNFAELVKPESVQFKSFDGLELQGWLYRPKGKKGPGAYVIDFHGGPDEAARPTHEYQPWLDQGIGIFAPNVRGSGGRGKAFADADNGPLRVNAIKDIKACVDYLTVHGIADQKKIGVMGHSHGGYMAMAALTEYPDLFAAGIDEDGPINLVSEVAKFKRMGYDLSEYAGAKVDENMLRGLSPSYKTDRIKAPFMIQQGEADLATDDAAEAVQKLKARGAIVEYIVFAGEDHVLYKLENKMKSQVAKIDFMLRYLEPAP